MENQTKSCHIVYMPKKEVYIENDVCGKDNFSATSSYLGISMNNSNVSVSQEERDSIMNLEPLSPEKVRWFYKEKKNWIPFCGYDSLRLETKYREIEFNKEKPVSEESLKEMIVVRGDLFEVNVLKREGSPIYWIAAEDEQNSFVIMRGTWFREGSWQPLDNEELSNLIEKEHMHYFIDLQYQAIELRKSSTTEVIAQHLTNKFHLNVHSVIVNGYHVEWYNESTVYYYMDSASHFIRQKLGLTKVGSRLSRGYKSDARIEDKLPDITHLIFVIHGVGQKMKGGDIVYQVNRLRTLCRKVTKRFFPRLDSKNQRVEFLPVEWRKLLILDGDTVDLITPNRNKGLRNAVNSTALDVLYYSSPIYRPEMVDSLRNELNRLYSMFCARSPYFEDKGGKISILAHSLGAVLVYDILTNWSPANIYEYLENLDSANRNSAEHEDILTLFSELNQAKENVHQLELKVLSKAEQENTKRGQTNFREANFPSNFIQGKIWKVFPRLDNFFCVGSPLAVFLALRGMKPQDYSNIYHILPQELCRRIYNIFHPADPVVYRLEPLVNKMYFDIEPVRIHRLDQAQKTPYDNMPLRRSERLDDESAFDENLIPIENCNKEDYVVKTSSKKRNSKERIIKFFNRFMIAKDAKQDEIIPHLDKIDFFLPKDDLLSSKSTRRKRKFQTTKNLNEDTNKSQLNFNQSQSIKNVSTANRRGTTFSSFRFPKLKQFNNMRKSLRGRPSNYNNGLSDLYLPSYHIDDNDNDETLNESDSESHSSDDAVFDTSLKPLQSTSLLSETEVSSPPTKELKVRIDYRLPESRYESSYLSVLTSHTCYWNSGELCQFMLTQIFGHLGSAGNPI